MRGETCAVCCGGLCQHPECWRSSIQKVREAVWRRNGGIPHDESHEAPKVDSLYMQKEKIDSTRGDLPTLKIVDMFSDLNTSIRKTSKKHIEPIHQRSHSLPCLPSAIVSHDCVLSPPRSPRQSPALASPLTEYRHRMKWKKELNKPSGTKSAANSVKMSTIGVHELYEEDELDQEWQEVYVTSAYLVWCPSTKKGRKAKQNSTKSNKDVLPKDVTEELVPASMETKKQCRPKSTKTPTGGQPFSPSKHVSNAALYQYGMEDLSNLPKPVLSGILKRINWRSNKGSPNEEEKEPKNSKDEVTDLTSIQQVVPKVLLAVDINSQLTTPEQDKQLEEQTSFDKEKRITTNRPIVLQPADLSEIKQGRTFLSMHPVGLPIDDLPEPKHHHCTNSIPRRVTSLGVALEPVNLVSMTPSPSITTKQLSPLEVSTEKSKPDDPSLVVNVPSGRPESAPINAPLDVSEKFADRYYVNSAFRYTPSPVRAPASTPISPDKYLEFARYSRTSRRRSSSQDEQILNSRRRLNTLGGIDDFDNGRDKCAPTDQEMLSENRGEFLDGGGGVFITEGSTDLMNSVTFPFPKCRSPSPGSRTCIPKDIIEQFHGDIYGRRYSTRAECDGIQIRNVSTHIGAGILAPGWRPPRLRTPIQLSETPARYPPRPLRQPPLESVPKSLQIVSIPNKKKVLTRPRSTPPRPNSPKDNDLVPFVLSESSLVNLSADSTVSMEVQGPSSDATDSGAVPPPPSPEAMLGLKNELQPTLETLCEEDERSSRTTNVVDIVEKDVPLSRLSPLGGGSEISEESVDLPIEVTDEDQSNENNKAAKLHLQSVKCTQSTGEKPNQNQKDSKYNINVHRTTLFKSSSELQQNEKACEPRRPEGSPELQLESLHKSNLTAGGFEPHPTVKSTEQPLPEKTSESRAQEHSFQHAAKGLYEPHQTSESYQQFPSESSYEPHPSEELSNQLLQTSEQHAREESREPHCTIDACEPFPGFARPLSSPDLNPSQDSYQPGDPIGIPTPKPNSPEYVHQPPGSPDLTSNQDFTEGLDMGLDLAAELEAAMEGLDSFSVLSEDDDES